jgi:hypothetical protein
VKNLSWQQKWIDGKTSIARRLAEGEAGGSYSEAVILLCATLSAVAAKVWPGAGIDRARFVELLVRFGPERSACRTVSVPLLIQDLQKHGRTQEADILHRAIGMPCSSRVITGSEVDCEETKILAMCPLLETRQVRRFSYASMLYSEIRSSYAHEYRPSDLADDHPMTIAIGEKVSYINRLEGASSVKRRVHFHIDWLASLPTTLIADVERDSMLINGVPEAWWINGALF